MLSYIAEKNLTMKFKALVLVLFLVALAIFLEIINYFRNKPPNTPLKENISNIETPKEDEPLKPSLFYGVNVEMSQLLPASKNYIVNDKGKDLIDIASDLGINMFRITNGAKVEENSEETFFTKMQWDGVLDKMQEKGIQALILIESPTMYQKDIPPEYLDFVQSYIIDSGVLAHPAVFGVDLYNEPLITDRNIELMKTSAKMVKGRYPKTRLTVGWWAVATNTYDDDNQEIFKWDDYGAGRILEDFTDFYSLHMYGFDKKNLLGIYPDPNQFTRRFISKVKKGLQTKKPLLIGEFGSANGEVVSDQDTVGSPELQANTYVGVYQALGDLKDEQIIGSVSFQFYQRTSTPDAWAILKDKGNYYFPAAYVLQKYAKGNSDIPLSLPLKPVP